MGAAASSDTTFEVVVGFTSVKLKIGDIITEFTDAIVNLNNETLNQSFGVSKEILAAAGDFVRKECASLATVRRDEYAVTAAGQLKCKKIIHLVDVRPPRIVESVKRALKACDEHKFTTVSLPAFGTGAAGLDSQTSIKLIFEGLEGYLTDPRTSTMIFEIVLVVNRQDVYQGYLTFFQNYKEKSGNKQALIVEYPKSWTDMGKKEYLVITLKEDCQEYKKVKETFLATAGSNLITVLKIERIQNVPLFKKFSVMKQEVEKKNPKQQNVRLLYHGTSVDIIKPINNDGFNRSYQRVSLYGKGSYFAVESKYSCSDTYSKPDKDGKKYIYQATVITGKYCKGTDDIMEPPYVGNDPNAGRYDSVTDYTSNPNMFVVFYDYYAYPEYLITFKRGK